MIQHTSKITFPNGQGYNMVSESYYRAHVARVAILSRFDAAGYFKRFASMHELTPQEYQDVCTYDDTLANLQMQGHVGKAVRF